MVDVFKTAVSVRTAASKIKDMLVTLATDVPLPDFFNTFGLPAAELEVSFLPKLSAIATEAKLLGKEIDTERDARFVRRNNFAQNIHLLIKEEARRLKVIGDSQRSRQAELASIKETLNDDIDTMNAKLKAEDVYAQKGVKYNEKISALKQERVQFDNEMRAFASDLRNVLDQGRREAMLRRRDSLEKREAKVKAEYGVLEKEMADSNERMKALHKEGEEIDARTAQYQTEHAQFESDALARNASLESVKADLARLLTFGELKDALPK
jgi:hypothetical protein